MNANWLNRLNYKMPIYRGCTFEEVLALGGFYFLITTPIAMIVLKVMLGITVPAIIIGLVLAILFTQLSTKFVEKFKDGKPYGYLSQSLHIWLAKTGLKSSVYLMRQGKWSVRRTKP